jgi:hypothetical protein
MALAERDKKYTAKTPKKLPPDTYTDEEMKSPEFRAGVEKLKMAIRLVSVAQGDLDIGTYWTALHELAREILLSDKGEEQAEMYWAKLMEFAEWQFAQDGIDISGWYEGYENGN